MDSSVDKHKILNLQFRICNFRIVLLIIFRKLNKIEIIHFYGDCTKALGALNHELKSEGRNSWFARAEGFALSHFLLCAIINRTFILCQE